MQKRNNTQKCVFIAFDTQIATIIFMRLFSVYSNGLENEITKKCAEIWIILNLKVNSIRNANKSVIGVDCFLSFSWSLLTPFIHSMIHTQCIRMWFVSWFTWCVNNVTFFTNITRSATLLMKTNAIISTNYRKFRFTSHRMYCTQSI